jgi:hypothetical protein
MGKGDKMKPASVSLLLSMLFLGVIPVSGEVDPGERTALLRSAQRLEERAYDVLDEAIQEHRYFTRGQKAGLDALQDLAWVSSYFYEQVRLEANLYRTVADYEILAEAFHRAEWWMSRVPMDRDVHREFRQLGNAFRQLARHYGRTLRGFERVGHPRMDEKRYHEVLRTRVYPGVRRVPADGRGKSRPYLDIGLSFPGGGVRVVWR